ncbi:hypothetical protein San01_29200 [Streptomyces angustmyceticus]|uniref:Uncharacterized protein n=1 Tax=Streptomyces angustmyceticus TaxID=285578 RepID=A0A5J4L8F1_9ACTN|nr:hypothetical protein San01_29200 [Streptomyces angustmyceticus]
MAGSFTGRPSAASAGRNAARNVDVRGVIGCTSAKRAALRAGTLTAVRRKHGTKSRGRSSVIYFRRKGASLVSPLSGGVRKLSDQEIRCA